jgi:predicted O-methyltransferase YrrM
MNFEQHLRHHKEVVDKEVEGWFYPKDIILICGFLQELIKVDGDVCEIGVAYGKSAITLAQFKGNCNFYLYDIFDENARQIAEKNILKFATKASKDSLIWRLQDTTELTSEDVVFSKPLKFLHIDGCHEHSAVLNDLMLFSNYMDDKGIIVLDDFQDQEFPGVNSAAFQFSLSNANYKNWRVIAIADNKAYLCQKKYQEYYQKKLVDYIVKAKEQYNVPFAMHLGLREVLDVNVLMCDSRTAWDPLVIKESLFDKPIIG